MPAILDGYHWSKNPGSGEESDARGTFHDGTQTLKIVAPLRVHEKGSTLLVEAPVQDNRVLRCTFAEDRISIDLSPPGSSELSLTFAWDPSKSTLVAVHPDGVGYRWNGFDYRLAIARGEASATETGWTVVGRHGQIALHLAQPS
jgi:hypothetical protein